MNLEVGSTVGDYQIIDVLGAGGMGKVFKVRNTISNRVEAMKILLPDLSGEPELADRFLREIQVLARLEHPNIAGLRTALRFENQLLMVMEFVEGMALDKRLRQGPLPVQEAVRCIDQILAALAYAHKSGVIHRDIKPANMMLMPDGTVKLMDFGIAKGADDRRLTMTGGTMGSVYYMSPEQIRGNVVVDARSDLYSVGVSLYELVTGKHAFDGDSQFAILGAHLEKSPVPPIAIDPKLPQALNDLILLSVTREPDLRFQTAEAFRNALKSVSEATLLMGPPQPAAVTPASPTPSPAANAAAAAPPVTTRVAKSNRALWATVGALCFVAVLVAAIEFGPWKKAAADSPQKSETPPKQEVVASPAPASTPPADVPAATPPATAAPVPVPSTAAVEPPSAPKPNTARVPARTQSASGQSGPGHTTSGQSTAAMPSAPIQQQAPAQPPQQAPAQQPPADPQPDLAAQRAHRAELQKVRESIVMVSARVNTVHATLQSIQRSQASTGLGMRSDWLQMSSLMDSFMQGSNEALAAGDSTAAKDFLDKAERQLERLEKALNK
jgi:serine/threonine-protein kinase